MSVISNWVDLERPRSLRRRWRELRAERATERAIRQLRIAIREAGDELSLEWLTSDPDLDELRDTAEWVDLLRGMPEDELRVTSRVLSGSLEPGPLPVPARPWGSPGRRIVRNLVAACLAAILLIWATDATPGGWLLAFAVLAIAGWRIGYLAWEMYVDSSDDLLPPSPR